jgi:hypothetical protein
MITHALHTHNAPAAHLYSKKIGQQWRAEHPKATVYGETRSESKHAELRAAGIEPVLRAQRAGHSCPNVVCCAAPSGITSEVPYDYLWIVTMLSKCQRSH